MMGSKGHHLFICDRAFGALFCIGLWGWLFIHISTLKLRPRENKMFHEAKLLNIQNLINSNDVKTVTGENDCNHDSDDTISWPELGHKNPDALELERSAVINVLTAAYGLVNAPAVWKKR